VTHSHTTPFGFPPETVLTKTQLAVALGTSEDQIERCGLAAVASYRLGARCPRWIWKDVIDWLHGGEAAA
jgi:hypothetical protein